MATTRQQHTQSRPGIASCIPPQVDCRNRADACYEFALLRAHMRLFCAHIAEARLFRRAAMKFFQSALSIPCRPAAQQIYRSGSARRIGACRRRLPVAAVPMGLCVFGRHRHQGQVL